MQVITRRSLGSMVGLTLILMLLSPHLALAQGCETPVATITSVQGTIEAKRTADATWQAVHLHDRYCPGDTIRVLQDSRADLRLANRSVLRLNANSEITLKAMQAQRTSLLSLLKGAGHFFSRGPNTLEVQTPYTVVGVRGTEFFVDVQATQTLLSIFEGEVLAANEAGELALKSGQSAVAERGKAPVLRVVANPRDAVKWALYYPPVVDARQVAARVAPAWRETVQGSAESYLQGDLRQAFERLRGVPEDVGDVPLLTYRATLRLAVGQVEAAEADMARALELSPNDSGAVALKTIMLVVQNEGDEALRLARQAVSAAPESATARVALSYAQQSRLDLQGARESLEQAVALAPEHATAWARLAEVRSSFGDLDLALEAAQRAVALEPGLSRTQSVLGFAFLTQEQTAGAVAAFAKAIELDQADPLPRLGLGLAKIRRGELQEGSQEIEIAASLDPNNALLHSYLGKTRFEQKLGPLDAREYDVAKRLDPRDPTPWFYDAIRKQTTNQPVEALRDLQQAIELNDNRAVYRSRLLLDADVAARSASLARIYSDLGFQARALAEGWQAVSTDPTNFSAHRFLADSYSVLPRHEIARVSELLQSQLLQPLNLTPIQPRLAESNLFLISAGGPGNLSFNEFTPLFNADRLVAQASGLWGEKGTYAGEAVASGIYKKVSFSLGASHFESDGFRANSDQDDDIVNAFVQLQLSPQTSLQAEYRYRDSERGDLQQRFFSEDLFPGQRHQEERHTWRLGARHALSPRSTLLASLIYQDVDASLRDDPAIFPGFRFADFQSPVKSFGVEVQHLFRSRLVNLMSGAGYTDNDGRVDTTFGLDLPPPPGGPGPIDVTSTQNTDIQHINIYAYAHLNLLQDISLIMGASYDALSGAEDILPDGDKDQFNPKFGVIWHPLPGTIMRAAAFRVLKRTLVTDQTLEPTQIAGFNQFYDDVGATEAWRYGLAIDQKFTNVLFGGAEMSKRDLKIPRIAIDPATGNPTTITFDAEEYLGRAYLFWAPHAQLSLRAEYIYERFKRDSARGFVTPPKLDTHRLPLGINLFHPTGLNASLTATYWHQDGEFERPLDLSIQTGNNAFWTVDAAIHYRLPKRYGFITIGATNLFDEPFRFFNTDFDNLTIVPDRRLFARVTLTLP